LTVVQLTDQSNLICALIVPSRSLIKS